MCKGTKHKQHYHEREKVKTMENNTKIYAKAIATKAQRKNHCILGDHDVFGDADIYKVLTSKQRNGYCVCKECYAKKRMMRKAAVNTAPNTKGKVTYYNEIMVDVVVTVKTTSEDTRAYFIANNWLFGDTEYATIGRYQGNNFQAISPMLDQIFVNDEKAVVRVNGQQIFNTEELRDYVDMKVRNAVVNKSLR